MHCLEDRVIVNINLSVLNAAGWPAMILTALEAAVAEKR